MDGSKRRRLLQTSAAAALYGLAGCLLRDDGGSGSRKNGTPNGTTESTPADGSTPRDEPIVRRGIEFDRVVDGVDDLEMDPTGETPVDDALDAAYETGTLVELPPGEYLAGRTHVWDEDVSRFGIVGTGESHTDTRFVFSQGNDGRKFRLFEVPGGSHHLLANLSFDQTMDDVTGVDVMLANEHGALIEDVEWLGRTPSDNHAREQHLSFDCTSVDGVNVARRVYMRQSAATPGYPDGVAGIRIGPNHVGEILMEDCHIEQRGSSAFRSTHPTGVLHVKGGLFENNDNTNLRVAAGDHPEKTSWIKGATVVVDVENLNQFAKPGDRIRSPEGLRVDATGHGYTGLLVEDCEFVYRSAPKRFTSIVNAPTWGGHGGFTMRNCRIHNETNVQTVRISRTDTDVARRPWGVRFEDVTITGSADSQPLGAAVFIGGKRPNSSISGSCLNFTGGEFAGIKFVDSSGCTVVDTNIAVPGDPVSTENADVTTSEVTYGGSCES